MRKSFRVSTQALTAAIREPLCASIPDEIQFDPMLLLPSPCRPVLPFFLSQNFHLGSEGAEGAVEQKGAIPGDFTFQVKRIHQKKPQNVLCDFQVFPVIFFLLRCPYVCYQCTHCFCSCTPFSMWSFLLRNKQKAISSHTHKSYCFTNFSPRSISGNFIYSLFVLRLCYCSPAL